MGRRTYRVSSHKRRRKGGKRKVVVIKPYTRKYGRKAKRSRRK